MIFVVFYAAYDLTKMLKLEWPSTHDRSVSVLGLNSRVEEIFDNILRLTREVSQERVEIVHITCC